MKSAFVLLGLLLSTLVCSQSFELEPLDRIRISSPDFPGLNIECTIDTFGYGALPYGLDLGLAGLTLEKAREKIQTAYEDQLAVSGIRVEIHALANPKSPVRVTGAVAASVNAYATKGMLLSEVLEAAKPSDLANLEAIEIRAAGKVIRVDARGSKEGWDREIRGGDRVFVPRFQGGRQIFVLGAVARGGAFDFQTGMTAKAALALAGGAGPAADLHAAEIIRGERSLGLLDLSLSDVPLQPGDTLRIPFQENPAYVWVVGGVARPGRVMLGSGLTLAEAVRQVGGIRPGAKGKIRIVRAGTASIVVEIEQFQQGTEGSLRLQDRDRVEIPEPRRS